MTALTVYWVGELLIFRHSRGWGAVSSYPMGSSRSGGTTRNYHMSYGDDITWAPAPAVPVRTVRCVRS